MVFGIQPAGKFLWLSCTWEGCWCVECLQSHPSFSGSFCTTQHVNRRRKRSLATDFLGSQCTRKMRLIQFLFTWRVLCFHGHGQWMNTLYSVCTSQRVWPWSSASHRHSRPSCLTSAWHQVQLPCPLSSLPPPLLAESLLWPCQPCPLLYPQLSANMPWLLTGHRQNDDDSEAQNNLSL